MATRSYRAVLKSKPKNKTLTLKEKNIRLIEALAYYADKDHWLPINEERDGEYIPAHLDSGDVARLQLEELGYGY